MAVAVGTLRAPATMNDEGLADAEAASPFRLPRLHPGIENRSSQRSDLRLAALSKSKSVTGRGRPGRYRQPVRSEPLHGGQRQLRIGLGTGSRQVDCQTTLRGQAPKVRRPGHALCRTVETARERGFVPVCARPSEQLLRAPLAAECFSIRRQS